MGWDRWTLKPGLVVGRLFLCKTQVFWLSSLEKHVFWSFVSSAKYGCFGFSQRSIFAFAKRFCPRFPLVHSCPLSKPEINKSSSRRPTRVFHVGWVIQLDKNVRRWVQGISQNFGMLVWFPVGWFKVCLRVGNPKIAALWDGDISG